MRGAVEFPGLCAATCPLEMPTKNNNSKHRAVVVPGAGLCLTWELASNSHASPFLLHHQIVNQLPSCQEAAHQSWVLRMSQGDRDQTGFTSGARELAFPLRCSHQWTLIPPWASGFSLGNEAFGQDDLEGVF